MTSFVWMRIIWGVVALALATANAVLGQEYPGEPPYMKRRRFGPIPPMHGFYTFNKRQFFWYTARSPPGFEQYDWTYLPLLANAGFDVCIVTYPYRGLGDMQIPRIHR